MKAEEIKEKIPKGIIKSLKNRGIEKFTPPQEESIKSGLLEGESLTVSSPTASGKTLVASLAFLKNIIERDGKAVYIVPLRSLASEKYNKFKKWYKDLGVDVAISIGNYDSADPWLSEKDLIIATSEKLDSLIRHGAKWIKEVNTVVIDEIHLLNDKNRGPNLEVLITRLKELIPNAQYIALSATINNDKELADWLDSKLIESDYRPVELKEGVYLKGEVDFKDEKVLKMKGKRSKPVQRLIQDTLERDKQALVFLSTRRSTESVAKKGKKIVKKYLSTPEKKKLFKIGEKVKNALEKPTSQCKELSKCVKKGIAFHHAGLVSAQKHLIEDAFRDRLIKVICCTPTLSYGVSIPADRTIIRDLKRFSPEQGSAVWIPVLEYQQFCGRAGRPEYSSEGEAITVAKKKGKKDEIEERYLEGEPEDILSKLAVKPILRMHILALIASNFTRNREQLKEFFSKTLYWHQYEHEKMLENKIGSVLQKLISFNFVESEEGLKPTKIGERVSELYIDPLTGKKLIDNIKLTKEKEPSPFSLLFMISNTLELQPWLKINKSNHSQIESKLAGKEDEIIEEVPSQWDYEYQRFLKAFRLSLMFKDWMNEMDEEKIMKKYGVAPGSLRSKLYNADWLLYSSKELANLLGVKSILKELTKLRIRMKRGVREELLNLVRLDQIGRVRARKLYKRGIKNTDDIKEVPYERLSDILGPAIAAKAKKQVGEDIEGQKEKKIGLEKYM